MLHQGNCMVVLSAIIGIISVLAILGLLWLVVKGIKFCWKRKNLFVDGESNSRTKQTFCDKRIDSCFQKLRHTYSHAQ